MPKEIARRMDLPEFSAELIIGPELIDENRHVNNASYVKLYQDQRALYLRALGIGIEETWKRFGLRPFLKSLSIDFKGEVYEGDHVTVYTAAEAQKARILFFQRMLREGVEVNNFQCTACFVDISGKPQRIPDEILEELEVQTFR